MHNLETIKNAAAAALDKDDPTTSSFYCSVADAGSVLEMAGIIQVLLHEVERAGTNPDLVHQVHRHLRGEPGAPQDH